jgi:uncharacterized membrane protein
MGLLAAAGILRLLGRFHPAAVHFPIAFLLAAAALEVAVLLRRRAAPADPLRALAFAAILAGAAGALAAAPLGWLDAAGRRTDPEDAGLLAAHRWLGTFTAAAAVTAAALAVARRQGRLVRLGGSVPALVLAGAASVAVGAHIGGLLVHGRDYYSSALSTSTAVPTSPASPFDRDVLPILRRSCVRCHGPDQQKARLRLDSLEGLRRGGKSGAAIVPGDGAHSRLLRAVTDPNPDTRMPQEGPPLAGADIDRLRAWIDEGAR